MKELVCLLLITHFVSFFQPTFNFFPQIYLFFVTQHGSFASITSCSLAFFCVHINFLSSFPFFPTHLHQCEFSPVRGGTGTFSSGPPSPDLSARRSPYSRASQDSPDFLSGLLPKVLSPTPYSRLEHSGLISASPAASPVTVSALSHYSSSTAGLEELQICGMDSSPTATPTPSPTLSHTSNAPDELPTAPSAATGTNVTITLDWRTSPQSAVTFV